MEYESLKNVHDPSLPSRTVSIGREAESHFSLPTVFAGAVKACRPRRSRNEAFGGDQPLGR